MSRLQFLTTKFEKLGMNEDESICEFHIRLCNTANTYFALCENMFEEKLEKNFSDHYLRGLIWKWFDELIGSLQTFEMSINDRSEKKNKGISFVSNTKESKGDKE